MPPTRDTSADRQLDHGFQVHRDPGVFAAAAHDDLDLPEWGLDRGRTGAVGDGGGPASDEPAAADDHPPAGARAAVRAADDHGEGAGEQDIVFQG